MKKISMMQAASRAKTIAKLNPQKKDKKEKKAKMAIGEALSADEMKRIEKLFYEADEDGNGKLDIDEFVNTLSPLFGDPGIEKLTLLFRRMDANLDGEVDWDEFSTFMLLQSSSGEKEEAEGNKYGLEHVTDGSAAAGHGNHVAHVTAIVYSEAHQRYFTGSLDGTVRTWHGKHAMSHSRTIYNEDGWINDICILPNTVPEHEMVAVATNRSVSFYVSGTLELRSRVHTTAPSIDFRGSVATQSLELATDGLEPEIDGLEPDNPSSGRDPAKLCVPMLKMAAANDAKIKKGDASVLPAAIRMYTEALILLDEAVRTGSHKPKVKEALAKKAATTRERLAALHNMVGELQQYKRDVENTQRQKTCPQCLHCCVVNGRSVVAVGDDAGQVTLFIPPDPETSQSKALEIAKVEYQPRFWQHSQVMEWIKSLKLGDNVVEAFSRGELTGQSLVQVGTKKPPEAKKDLREKLGITKAFLLDTIYKKIVALLTPGSSIPLHKDWVTKMQYVPTPHQFFLSSSKDNTLLVTDIEIDWVKADDRDANGKVKEHPVTVRLRKVLNDECQGHHKGILDFVWCSGFKQIATCGLERYVQLWSPYGIPIGRLEPLSATTLAVAVNESKSQIICLSADNIISVWDQNNNKVLQTIDHQGEVADYIAAQPMQRPGIEIELDREVRLKEEAVAEAARASRGGNGLAEHRVSAIFFHEEAGVLFTGTMKLASWQTRAEARASKTERSHGCSVCCASYNPYMQQVVSCDDSSNILVWDFETGNLSYRIDEAHNGNKISAMAFDGNGSCLVTGGHDGCVKLWNLSTGKLLKEMVRPKKLENDKQEITALLFRSTLAGSYIIAGGWDRKVTMWADEERHDTIGTHVPKQQCYRQLEGHSVDIRCLAFHHPNTLASGCDGGQIILWNMDSGFAKLTLLDVAQKRTVLQTPNTNFYDFAKPQAVEQVTFLPATAVVVACYADGWIRFWDSKRGTLLRRHLGAVAPHGRTPMSLTVFPPAVDEFCEGKRILMTGDDGGGVQQWDVTAWDDPTQLAAAISETAASQRKSEEACLSLSVTMNRHWQAHMSGYACLSLQYVPPHKGRQAMVLTSGQDGNVAIFTIDGARVGNFRAQRARDWQLDRVASFMETRCTTSIPLDQNPPRSAATAERAAAASANAEVKQAAKNMPMAALFSPATSAAIATVVEGSNNHHEAHLAEPEVQEDTGHDLEALDIFAQLGAPSGKRAPSNQGHSVVVGSGSGRLVVNAPVDGLGIGLRGKSDNDSSSSDLGLRWLDGCKDLAPSVTEIFRRPRGGDARLERDQRRAALENPGHRGGHGHGSLTARGRLQTTALHTRVAGGSTSGGGGMRHQGGAHTARVPSQPQLAHGWVQKFTADGAPYYENLVAKTAQWERPVGTPHHPSAPGARSARRAGTYQLNIERHRVLSLEELRSREPEELRSRELSREAVARN